MWKRRYSQIHRRLLFDWLKKSAYNLRFRAMWNLLCNNAFTNPLRHSQGSHLMPSIKFQTHNRHMRYTLRPLHCAQHPLQQFLMIMPSHPLSHFPCYLVQRHYLQGMSMWNLGRPSPFWQVWGLSGTRLAVCIPIPT